MTSISTTFTGVVVTSVTAANPGVVSTGGHTLSTGDVVLHEAMDQMTELNGNLFEIEVNGNDWWIKTAFNRAATTDATARLDLSAFTAEVSGGTASLGLSTALVVPVAGDDITVTLTGTWVATIALEKEIGYHSNAWTEVERWTANTFRTYQSKAANQRWRLRLITWTSGTITGVLADVDKIEETFLHDDGTEWMEVTQAGVTFRENLSVDGDTTLTGNLTVTGTQTFTGTLDVATLDVEVIEAGDASLGVNGLDAAQGGTVVVMGGTSSTAGNAGGSVDLVGGTAGSTGVGGAVVLTGAPGGSSSGKGGGIAATTGAANGGNDEGGDFDYTGGAGEGSGRGGRFLATAGQGGGTGVGGGSAITAGAGGATSGAGGIASVIGGAATAGDSAGGAVNLTGGAAQGTAAGGAVNLTSGAAENGTGGVSPGASGAVTLASGAAGTTDTGTAGASGAVILETPAGGAASGSAGIGGASGALTIRTGAGGAASDSSSGVAGHAGDLVIDGGDGGAGTSGDGGDGGDITITGGLGGAANAAGDDGGEGGNVALVGGVGGADVQGGTGVGAKGGDITLTGGVGGTGSSGEDGGDVIINSGAGAGSGQAGITAIRAGSVAAVLMGSSAIVADSGNTATMTAAIATSGIHVKDPVGSLTYTFPTGTLLTAAFATQPAAGDWFLFTLINSDATGGADITFAAGDNTIMVGYALIHPVADVAEGSPHSATWLVRNDAGSIDWTWYRIS